MGIVHRESEHVYGSRRLIDRLEHHGVSAPEYYAGQFSRTKSYTKHKRTSLAKRASFCSARVRIVH